MNGHNSLRAASRVLLIIAGTIAVMIMVSFITVLATGRISSVNATSANSVPTIVPPTPRPTNVVPPKVGDLINNAALHAINRGGTPILTMRVTDQAPLITQQEAQQIAFDASYPYAFGGNYEGREITVNAVYGLLSHGFPGDTSGLHLGDDVTPLTGPCAGWVGPCNIPVKTCRDGVCKDTGKTIPRIEQRPYWLLDYEGFHFERQACPDCPIQVFNHAVLVVDAQDKFVLMGFPYTSP